MFARLAVVALALLAFAPASALACSCVWPGVSPNNKEEFQKRMLEKAELVVRGKVVSFGESKNTSSWNDTEAKMRVEAVVKGNVQAKEIAVATAYSDISCGIGRFFAAAAERDAVIEVQLYENARTPGIYEASLCGYRAWLSPQLNERQ